jgi:transposase-like protein
LVRFRHGQSLRFLLPGVLYMLYNLGMEQVFDRFIRCHVLGMLISFLFHGASMSELDLCSLIQDFGSEDKCRHYLERLRWPRGVTCPECKSNKISRIATRNQFDCDSCRYQFSATSGTIFHDTHLPLWKWFLATYLLCESRKGMSANQISRMLKITYKTSWYLCHRIRHTMVQVAKPNLDGTVEMDETFVGGKKIGFGQKAGKAAKEVVIGIRKRGGDLRFFHADDVKSGTLARYIRENFSEHVDVLITDDFSAYPRAMTANNLQSRHKTVNYSKKIYVEGTIHTNTVESVFSMLKRGIIGTWHRVSAKHLPAYLDEMCFRFNNRKNDFLFRDTMLKLIGSPNLEYKQLTAKVQDAA